MDKAAAPEAIGYDPATLIETYQAGIWRYLRALGCDPSLAEDLTQDTFVAVLQKPFTQYSPAATAAYLKKVAYNLFISAQRRAGKVATVEDLEQLDRCWQQWVTDDSGEDLIDVLRGCLNKLTERARWALEMRFRDRLSRTEIAAKLSITDHGAKNLMQRAKQQLKQCIERKQK